MQTQCGVHATISGIGPGLGVDGGGKAEWANRRGGVGNAKKVSSAGRQLHAADRASVGLEDVFAGVGESESEEKQQQAGSGHCWGLCGQLVTSFELSDTPHVNSSAPAAADELPRACCCRNLSPLAESRSLRKTELKSDM